MIRLLLAALASLVLAGCSTSGSPVSQVNSSMVTKVNAELAMTRSDREIMDMAAQVCRDFSYIYDRGKALDYIQAFATINTHNNQMNAARALGSMLGGNCPATGQKMIAIVKG